MWLKRFFQRTGNSAHPVKQVFFVLSTGRCGTRYISNLLNTAPNATVLHQPQPGCERINPVAYELFIGNPRRYLKMRVKDFPLLHRHADIYKTVTSPVYGDCYNSIYPFGIALFRYFRELGIDAKFIHLVRNPVACASSILRAEGPFGIAERKDFKTRAQRLFAAKTPAENAAEIWININRNIRYQMTYIEQRRPNTTRLIRLEDIQGEDHLQTIDDLFRWLGLDSPGEKLLVDIMRNETDEVRHSHQKRLDGIGIPRILDDEIACIKNVTGTVAGEFGYAGYAEI